MLLGGIAEAEREGVYVVRLLLSHGTGLDGLGQIFIHPVGRLRPPTAAAATATATAAVKARVPLLHRPLRLLRHFVLLGISKNQLISFTNRSILFHYFDF